MHIRVHRCLEVEVAHDAALHSQAPGGNELGEVSNVEVLRLEVDAAEVLGGDNGGVAEVS